MSGNEYIGKTLAALMLQEDPGLNSALTHQAYDYIVASKADVEAAIVLGTGFPGSLIRVLSARLDGGLDQHTSI